MVVLSGCIFVIGGVGADGKVMSSVEKYDPRSGKWQNIAALSVGRMWLGAALLNDVIYVVGGSDEATRLNSVERYAPSQNKWLTSTPMIESRRSHAVAALNGYLYVIGGLGGSEQLTDTVERFDPTTETWSKVGSAVITR